MNLHRFVRILLVIWGAAIHLFSFAEETKDAFRFTLRLTGKRASEEQVLYVSRCKAPFLESYTEICLLIPKDSSGVFSGSIPCKAMETITFSGTLFKSSLVAEPGGFVECEMPINDSLSSGFTSKPFVRAHIIRPENSIQAGLEEAENILQNFYSKHYALFIKPKMLRAKLPELDSSFKALETRFSSSAVHSFCTYSLAKLYEICGASKTSLERSYIWNPSLKRDLWWRGFFSFHYKNYFSRFQTGPYWKELEDAIEKQHSIEQLRAVIKKLDPIQCNDTLRDILIVYGLFDIRNQKNIQNASIQMLLRYLATQATGDESKLLAKACLQVCAQFETGERIQATSIASTDWGLIHQQAAKKQLVWWCAFDPNGPEMEREWSLLNKLMVVYQQQLGVVLSPVMLKKSQRFYLPGALEKAKDAAVVPLTNLQQTEQLGIAHLPFCSLVELDSDGNILWHQWSCPLPSQGLETMLKTLFSKHGK